MRVTLRNSMKQKKGLDNGTETECYTRCNENGYWSSRKLDPEPKLHATKVTVIGYSGAAMPVKRKCTVKVTHKDREHTFTVLPKDVHAMLGTSASVRLMNPWKNTMTYSRVSAVSLENTQSSAAEKCYLLFKCWWKQSAKVWMWSKRLMSPVSEWVPSSSWIEGWNESLHGSTKSEQSE